MSSINRVCLNILLPLLTVLFLSPASAQKVGIVLSGGGASGLAHIGFLRALEEEKVPIDYISGSSMGALVGALYSAGYTTQQMEKLFSSEEFMLWASGKIDARYVHYFKKLPDDASWVKLKITLDSIFETNLPTNIVNSTSLDFGLAELFSSASAISKGNFDSLLVPFRCLASDITKKETVVFRSGDLATAVRASISYPFYLNPVNIDGNLLYDGGLYDNFPVSTLCSEFEPDFILGSNVSYNFPKPDEDNVLSQIRSMMSHETKYRIECEKGMIVNSDVPQISLLDFSRVSEIVEIGYKTTMGKMDSIKQYLTSEWSRPDIVQAREEFNKSKPVLQIKKITVSGLQKSEQKYIVNSLRYGRKDTLHFKVLESKILRLASDEKILRIDPDLVYNDSIGGFELKLKVKKEKNFFVSFGGNISTLAVNEGFVALQYNYLSSTPITVYGNTYFGKFYSSGSGLMRFDVPAYLPLQFSLGLTLNKWDYFQNSGVLFEESAPSYLIQRENFGQAGLAFPTASKGKIGVIGNIGTVKYEYYQDDDFSRFDTADITTFSNNSAFAFFERNSLNKKQYANSGNFISLKAGIISGTEDTKPGSALSSDTAQTREMIWYRAKARIDQYFGDSKLKFGLMFEAMYSDQPYFSNYASTLLSSPAFEPIPESKTVFRSKFRSPQYGAAGVRLIYSPVKNFDIRTEGFMFKPAKEIVELADHQVSYNTSHVNQYFIGSLTLLYDLTFTQIALNVNYYDNFNVDFPANKPENYTVMLHLGFILFNQKMLE